MIKWFRSGIAVKAAGVVFAGLMMIFMLTSVDWGKLTAGTSVGKVNGHAIDARTYQREVQQAVDARQRQSSQNIGLDEHDAIRNEVWDQFVTNELLHAEYRKRDIHVSDDEVIDAIRTSPLPEFYRLPEFQTDSQFDPAKYQKWLTSSVAQKYIPAMEAQYREQLERSKFYRAVTADVYLPESALWDRFRDQRETAKIDLAAIVPAKAVPDSVVSVTPAEIESYYRAHTKELERSKTVFTSYVSVPRFADASDTAAARTRAEQVRKEIVGGAPFAEVAKRESADTVSGNKGGELGEWTRGTFAPAFDSAAFKLPINAVSDPVLTQFGFHIIQVASRTGNKAKGRHVLIPIEVTGAHRDRLDAQADSLERLAADRLDPAALDTVARALKLPIGKPKPLLDGEKIQIGVLAIPDAGVWASGAKVGQISPIVETPVAMYLFRADSIHQAGVPPLADVRDEVTQLVRNQKKIGEARKIGEELEKRIAGGASLAQAAEGLKLPHEIFGPLSRLNAPIRNAVVVGTAFGLDAGKTSGVIETKDGLYVLQVLQREKADSAAFVKQLDQFRSQTQTRARQERVQTYLGGLRAGANIVDQRSKVLQSSVPEAPVRGS